MNTDDYEGHTPAPWMIDGDDVLAAEHPDHDPEHGWPVFVVSDCDIENEADARLIAAAPDLLAEVKRLLEIEQEWLTMWATLEELNLVAPVRQNMEEHGFEFD